MDQQEVLHLVHTVVEIAKADIRPDVADLLGSAQVTIEETGYDRWNNGTYYYTVNITVDTKNFIAIRETIESIESLIAERFKFVTRHWIDHQIVAASIIPRSPSLGCVSPNPHRPFSEAEEKRRNDLIAYLQKASEDELIEEVLLPLLRQLGFHRITFAGHKDKALEYGKDIWMKYMLPTQHVLYFGLQVKKGKLDARGMTTSGNANVAEVYNQALMMLGNEIFDAELNRKVLVDHAFIVAGGEITKQARQWIGEKLDINKRSQIMFLDRDDILNLYVVTSLPLPEGAIVKPSNSFDDLPF